MLVIEDLSEKGFNSKDWFKYKLNHQEVLLSLTELAKFHACGLAYRMSLKEEIDEKYPYLEDDLYTSNMAKELLAKYLDSYLHFLTYLDPSIQVRKVFKHILIIPRSHSQCAGLKVPNQKMPFLIPLM